MTDIELWSVYPPLARGTLLKSWLLMWIGSVYPRWRGEHYAVLLRKKNNSGLSPLARGTRA
ncbi:hypothetical protein SEEM180_16281 [Salmonella enterica subsp. enterica serovar Montevideo str. 413180]|nr:hypothetical protein SEEM180_16281 [Salmonella enterica subsp. enterica serovar Montevideo str. 413180]